MVIELINNQKAEQMKNKNEDKIETETETGK